MKTTYILLIFFMLSCNNNNNESEKNNSVTKSKNADENTEFKPKYKVSGKLVPIDLNDKRYIDVNFYCKIQ